MSRQISLFLITLLFFSPQAFAKRYITPSDANVRIDLDNGSSSRGALSPDSIKIFVWNMYKGDKPTWERDYTDVSRHHDILMLQEMYLDPQMKRVLGEDIDYDYQMATAWVDTKKKRNIPSGVATASKVKPVKVFWQRSKYREPFIRTHKMVVFTEYAIQGTTKTLLTANIHAINFVSSRKLKHMLKKAAQVLGRHDGPAIFAGDFNTWSKRKIRRMNKVLRGIGMTTIPFSKNVIKKVFGNPLDYIWHKGLTVKTYRAYDEIQGSDHVAMAAEFSVPL